MKKICRLVPATEKKFPPHAQCRLRPTVAAMGGGIPCGERACPLVGLNWWTDGRMGCAGGA